MANTAENIELQYSAKTSPSLKVKLDFNYCFKVFLSTFAVIFIYTFLRYVIFKGVALVHIPVYIFNKTIAVTGIALMCSSYLIGPLAKVWPSLFRRFLRRRAYLGVMGFVSIVVHTVWSLMTLNPQIHAKFYDATGALSPIAEWSFFFATIGTVHLAFLAVISITVIRQSMDGKQWKAIQESGLIALLFGLGHLIAMGSAGWFPYENWKAPLPPTTLVSATLIVATYFLRAGLTLYGKRSLSFTRLELKTNSQSLT